METTLKLLLIEDDLVDVKIFQRTLRDGSNSFHLLVVNTLANGVKILQEQTIDLIFVDPGLPDSSGLKSIRQVLDCGQGKPVIVLTGSDDEDLPIQAIELGAHDYLIKDTIDNQSLKRSIRYALEKNMILSDLRDKSRLLELSEQRFRHLIENNSDSALIININGVVKFANKSAEDLFGRRQENFVGKVFEYPVQKGEMSEIQINSHGQLRTEAMHVFETEWDGEKAYLVSLRDI
ncbi:MAG: response regulator [Candidatus Zhuqueibacterota bacterium]